jgi:hypothetical protein
MKAGGYAAKNNQLKRMNGSGVTDSINPSFGNVNALAKWQEFKKSLKLEFDLTC